MNKEQNTIAELLDEIYVELYNNVPRINNEKNKDISRLNDDFCYALAEQMIERAKALHPTLYKVYIYNVFHVFYEEQRQKGLLEKNSELVETNKLKTSKYHAKQ